MPGQPQPQHSGYSESALTAEPGSTEQVIEDLFVQGSGCWNAAGNGGEAVTGFPSLPQDLPCSSALGLRGQEAALASLRAHEPALSTSTVM